jgi:hypothetical protein
MKIHLPLGVAEHELQQMQVAHQFLFQTPEHMDLCGMHCESQSDQKREGNIRKISLQFDYLSEDKSYLSKQKCIPCDLIIVYTYL